MMLFATLLQGFIGGSIMPIWAALVGRVSDSRVYGQTMGSTILFVYTISALTPMFSGWIYDLSGSYRILFLGMSALMLLAVVCMAALRLPQTDDQRLGYQAAVSCSS